MFKHDQINSVMFLPELIQDKGSVDLASLLLMVGNDASHEVGVGVPQSDHQLAELFLVELGHGPEHAFPGSGSELGVRHGLLSHTHNLSILPNVHCKDLMFD